MTINRPEALNALNSKFLDELYAAFRDLEADERVRVIVVTGSGDKAFVAGADIVEMKDMTPMQARSFRVRARRRCRSSRTCEGRSSQL